MMGQGGKLCLRAGCTYCGSKSEYNIFVTGIKLYLKVNCTTHSSLWADLGAIMMSSGPAELDFVNSRLNPVGIKPGQTVATAIQIDSAEMQSDIEPDDDKSIPSTESVFSCVENSDQFLLPCIISDKMMDAEEQQFNIDMDIIEPPLARPRTAPCD